MAQAKTFKALVTALAMAETKDEADAVLADVSYSYQHDKITYNDNELLYALGSKVLTGITGEKYYCSYSPLNR